MTTVLELRGQRVVVLESCQSVLDIATLAVGAAHVTRVFRQRVLSDYLKGTLAVPSATCNRSCECTGSVSHGLCTSFTQGHPHVGSSHSHGRMLRRSSSQRRHPPYGYEHELKAACRVGRDDCGECAGYAKGRSPGHARPQRDVTCSKSTHWTADHVSETCSSASGLLVSQQASKPACRAACAFGCANDETVVEKFVLSRSSWTIVGAYALQASARVNVEPTHEFLEGGPASFALL